MEALTKKNPYFRLVVYFTAFLALFSINTQSSFSQWAGDCGFCGCSDTYSCILWDGEGCGSVILCVQGYYCNGNACVPSDRTVEIKNPSGGVVASQNCPSSETCGVSYSYCGQAGQYTAEFTADGEAVSANAYYCGCADGSKQCSGSWVQTCTASGTWSDTQNCDSTDGCYAYGNGCEQRNYYCSGGGCTYSSSGQSTDYYDGYVNYCSGETVRKHQILHDFYCSGSCSDHTSWQNDQLVQDCNSNNYYYDQGADSPISTNYCRYVDYTCSGTGCAVATDTVVATCGTCAYCSGSGCSFYSSSTQGPTSDGWACNGAIREYRDYHCTGTGASETYTPSQQEDCAAKSSTDSDGSPAAYTTVGTVTDCTGCSSGNCAASSYADSYSGTVLTEYGASGASYTSGNYNCESYETAFCSNGKQYRNEWSCGSSPGQCYDTGTDTQIGTDTDGDGVDQQCEDTAACDRNAATAGICNTAVSGKCVAKTASEALCSDGKDNDCDGLADCSDPDCAGSLSGSIKNSNGEALTNADNNAKAEAYQGAIRANTYSSDASGNYNPSKTRDVLCCTYNVVASAEQYVSKSVPSVQVPPQTDVIVQFTGSNALAQGTQCDADCTYAGDNTLHQECNNVNNGSSYTAHSALARNHALQICFMIDSDTR